MEILGVIFWIFSAVVPIVGTLVFLYLAMSYSSSITRKNMQNREPGFRMFFERTGYRYADILQAPLEQHIMYGDTLMQNSYSGHNIHMIRNFDGRQIHHIYGMQVISQEVGRKAFGYWSTPLKDPPE